MVEILAGVLEEFEYAHRIVKYIEGEGKDSSGYLDSVAKVLEGVNILEELLESLRILRLSFFAELPHVPEAWINGGKTDSKDGDVGIVGYEIPFNRHFYVYQPPRPLEEIDADLDKVSAEIMELLREVHS